jgi:hypothetical protein
MLRNKDNKTIDLNEESELTQLRYISAVLIKSYMDDKKYTNNDILTKKLSPEFFLEEYKKTGTVLTQDEEEVEEMLGRLREVLYTILVDCPDKATNKKV